MRNFLYHNKLSFKLSLFLVLIFHVIFAGFFFFLLFYSRVKFSGFGKDRQEPQQTTTENKMRRVYFSSEMSQDYDTRESEFAAAVAAAAYAVHSLEQAELQYQREKQEAVKNSRSKAKSRKDEIMAEVPSSSRAARLFSNKEAETAGEVSRKRSVGWQDDKVSERALPAKQPSRSSSIRRATSEDRYQMQKGTSPGHNGVESKADDREKTQMKKAQSRYEKTKFAILEWENEKKMQAKIKMEKRESLLEQRRGQNMQHYQNKVVRIERIAGNARAQLEEKRRNEELAAKDKAKKIRSRGNVPVKCFCFTC